MSGPARETRETRIRAACQDAPFCRWTYNGPRTYVEADSHARRTGHDVVVSEEITTRYEAQR